jgi:hypothetical protein
MATTRRKAPKQKPGMGRPIELTGRWLALAEAAGGVGALCAAIGVHKPSFYVWVRGGPMRGTSKTAVRAVAERLGVPSPIPEDP